MQHIAGVLQWNDCPLIQELQYLPHFLQHFADIQYNVVFKKELKVAPNCSKCSVLDFLPKMAALLSAVYAVSMCVSPMNFS